VNGKKSADRLQFALVHLRGAFAGQKAVCLTTARITTYMKARQQAGAANATINRELATLKRAFQLGLRSNMVGRVPHIALLEERNARTGFFERDQYLAVRAQLAPALQPLIDVAYLTGWRLKSELMPLTWDRVDFPGGWIRLEPGATKHREGRMFPLIPELRQVLQAQREHTDTVQKTTRTIIPWVFHRQGERMVTLMRAWRTAVKKAGCPGRIPHDFRRTAVRNLERAGVSRSAAMKMVGHKTEAIYRRYAIVSEGDLKHAGTQLAAIHTSDQAVPSAKVVAIR
jgi:integrase